MQFDTIKRAIAENLSPVDFAEGLYDGALKEPAQAVKQLCGGKLESETAQKSSLAAKAGNLAGFVLDYGILARMTDGVLDPVLGSGAKTVAGAGTKMFISGAIYGGVLTPSQDANHVLRQRWQSALVDGTTFAVMGAANQYLEDLPAFTSKTEFNQWAQQSLSKRVQTNAIAGGVGGIVNTLGSTYFTQHRLATPGELTEGAAEYAAFGAGFGALSVGLEKTGRLADKIPVVENAGSKYHRMTSDLNEKLRTRGYQMLDRTGLSHPLQDLGNMVHGSEPIIEGPHPAVTADNNPVPKFEEDMQNYFRSMTEEQEKLNQVDRKDWEAREEIHDRQKAISQGFARSMVRFYNGSAEEPGLRFYSDQELSTGDISPQRVADLRQALSITARDGNLMTALSKLAGIDITADLHGTSPNAHYRTYDLSALEISKAKEEHFQYDHNDIIKRLALRHPQHTADRMYLTPKKWMAHVENEELPGMFHGTGSLSLSSLFRERQLLPASELRIRGIKQVSGEGVDHEFAKSSISLSRNYGVAYSYADLSSDYVPGYPTMLGISSETVANAQKAGIVEPGELLMDKLRLGDSIFGPLARKQITHIHVPDSEVADVQARLAASRIKGVNVFGFNQLNTPTWNDIPAILYRRDSY
ncbi:MAG TPA: hypothetical protein V6C81_08520 [Planktothrix sp.]|jgi:hypothetical protein